MFSIISMGQLEVYLERKWNHGLGFILLDVRSPEEFQDGHLESAINIPLEELEDQGWRLTRDDPIVVYCGHGSKSLMAARMLDRMGFLVMAAAGGLASYRGKYYKSI